MLLLLWINGPAWLPSGLQSGTVRLILAWEAAALALGVALGLLLPGRRGSRLCLALPAAAACGLLLWMNGFAHSDAYMLLPFLAEDLLLLSLAACLSFCVRRRRGPPGG